MFEKQSFDGLGSLEAKHKAELEARESDHGEANQMNEELNEHLKKVAEIKGSSNQESGVEQKEIFKIWRTVELGNGLKTAKDFEEALRKAGREIGSEALRMLKEVEKEISENASSEKREVDLVDATPAELGLPNGGTLEQIYAAAEKKGLEKCPREAGPQSAIQYEDQPKDDYRLIGADPVVGSNGNRRVFDVDRDSAGWRWLHTCHDGSGRVWNPDDRFVFVRRKQSELKP